jgi:glycosyltransferase involved in cell wall biosynthesis
VLVLEGPTQDEVRELYSRATALVFPAHEDFGMIPVEAQACGTPVIALAAGGAVETVRDGVTGALVPELTASAFASRIGEAAACDPMTVREHAIGFSYRRFREEILAWVDEVLASDSR